MKIQNGFSLQAPSPEAKAQQQDKQLREAAEMYEGYFLDRMVKAMRSTVDRDNGVLKQNFAEKIFEGQLDQQYVENWAKKGGVGLADMIYNQIRERIDGARAGAGVPASKGMLPIAPRPQPMGIPSSDSIQMKTLPSENGEKMSYRFEVPNPSGGEFEAQAPMDGKIVESKPIGEGWNAVKLAHGRGLTSELTFPGRLALTGTSTEVQAGQKLGILDSTRPVLAWKLDWT